MTNISQWDPVAANNTATPPAGAPEGMQRSSVNDTMREMMAATSRWYGDANGTLLSTGTGTAYVLATNNAHAALADQSLIAFRANVASGAAPTLNVDTLGAKALTGVGVDTISANQIVVVAYNVIADAYDVFLSGGATGAGVVTEKITTYNVTSADDQKVIPVNSSAGAFTVNLPAAASSTDLKVSFLMTGGGGLGGTGNRVTLDANLTELIGSDETFEMLVTGHRVSLICNGTKWFVIENERPKLKEVFTSSGTWTRPKGVIFAESTVWGGGGGGGGSFTSDQIVGRGGAGGGLSKSVDDVSGSATVTVTVGAAGTAGTSTGSGGTGGTSSFGAFAQATGGTGAGAGGGPSVSGGIGSLGDINWQGEGGGIGGPNSASTSDGNGGDGAGGGAGAPTAEAGGAGLSGRVPGGGGAGGHRNFITSRAGGAGARGEVHVEY